MLGDDLCLGRGLGLIPPQKYSDTSQRREQDQSVTEEAQRTEGQLTDRSEWLESLLYLQIQEQGFLPLKFILRLQHQLVEFSEALRVSEALRSSLMTADKASGLMPCSHSLTHMDRDSMSKPVFSNLEISSSTSIVSRTAFKFALAALAIVLRVKLANDC